MLDITQGLLMHAVPRHYIAFGPFDSRDFGLNLHQRTAPTPPEKEILATIPYRQGVIDMSNLLGHRVYDNRQITYTFYRFGVKQNSARDFQTTIENLLMRAFDQQLIDSYEPDFYYSGKCQEVQVIDEYNRNRIRIQLTFDLYPFKMDKNMEQADLFDPFNFDLDAFQGAPLGLEALHFEVTHEPRTLNLYNASQQVVNPIIQTATSGIRLSHHHHELNVLPGQARTYPSFRLAQGMNTVILRLDETTPATTPLALMSFNWRKERI